MGYVDFYEAGSKHNRHGEEGEEYHTHDEEDYDLPDEEGFDSGYGPPPTPIPPGGGFY
jgi:hypothetical protein